jgi:predicted  nucleic acid-binding Zn-ribbon protein
MGDGGVASSGFGKSARSLLDALNALEREIEVLIGRARAGSSDLVSAALERFASPSGGTEASAAGRLNAAKVWDMLGSGFDTSVFTRGMARTLGLADEASLDAVRTDVREILEQVAKLREREIALAGGISQLRARTARFDEALAGLARIQGKYVARLDTQARRSQDLERLASRRDDHITRLIRDTAAHRAELERVGRKVEAKSETAHELRGVVDSPEVAAKLSVLESEVADIKRLQKQGTQSTIETLDSLRDRVGKIEARVAEMSREARAKRGRLDALARHVAGVENRLTSALGKGGKPVVAAATELDSSVQATG